MSSPAFEVFFDGDCPLCRREIAMIGRLDKESRVQCTDIAAPGFDPASIGKTHAELMAKIHGRLPDGTFVEGVEVFRRIYAEIGFAPLVKVSRFWPIAAGLDLAYEVFAKNRLRLTGRCDDGACAVGAPAQRL